MLSTNIIEKKKNKFLNIAVNYNCYSRSTNKIKISSQIEYTFNPFERVYYCPGHYAHNTTYTIKCKL